LGRSSKNNNNGAMHRTQIIMIMISLRGKILWASRNKKNCRKTDSKITTREGIAVDHTILAEVADDNLSIIDKHFIVSHFK
jgi:hypothetical protein